MAYAAFLRTLPTPATTLTGFTCLLDEAWFTQADTNALDGTTFINGGGSLKIYTDSGKGTQLPIDVVTFVTGGTPDVLVWVRLPSYASGATVWVESDAVATSQPAVTATYGRNDVWQDYDFVGHLGEAVNTTSGGYIDSSGSGYDATGVSMALPAVTANFGMAQDFDGTADYIDIPANAINTAETNNEFIMSCWVNMDSLATDGTLIGQFNGGSAQFLLYMDEGVSANYRALVQDSSAGNTATNTSSGGALTGTWQFVHSSWDGTTLGVYLDGTLNNASTSARTMRSATTDLSIGSNNGGSASRLINGKIHSVKITPVSDANARNKIVSEYTNQSAPSTFGTSSGWTTGGAGTSIPVIMNHLQNQGIA